MRKGIKIKCFILLVSWFLIFAHEIIPHNHVETLCCTGTGLIHTENHNEADGRDFFRSLCEDFSSCGIAGFLFQKFSNDENFMVPDYKTFSSLIIPASRIKVHFTQNHFTEDPSGTVPLRAPPVA